MNARYHIGEFAELGGVSAKTLRFYDKIGLLRPASVDPRTRYRLYSPHQLEDLASILALKNLGISLAQVREFIEKSGSISSRRTILTGLKRTIEQSIQSATQSLLFVNAALDELGEQPAIAVVVKRRPSVPIASFRVTVKNYAEVPRFEEELHRAVPPQCLGSLRGVLWHRCADSGTLEAEPFVVLKQPALNQRALQRAGYDVKRLPEAVLACAYSGLDDDSSEQAYAAVRRWMNVRGYRDAGPKRELNLGERLEIQFPLMEN